MEVREKISTIPEIPGLEFDENGHIYRLDGIIIPSVSAVMAPLSKFKYEGINSKTLEKAAGKGTAVHNAIENWIKFDIEDVPPEYQGYFGAFRMWWDKYKPEVVGSEIRMCHRLMRYAGTADLVAYIDDELTLVDYKTTYTISDMTCGVQLEAYGIDVSYHQGVIDWKKTASELRRVNGGKNPGFAFLRVGRSNLDGKGGLSLDSQWENNLAGCEANGVPVGVYWYCYDESVAAVMQTAHDVVDQLKGHKFDYPIVFDMEYEPFNTGTETDDPDKKRPIEEVRATNTAMIQAALEVLEHEGYYAVLYCSRDFFLNYTDLSELTDYDKWEAAYTSSDTDVVTNGIWQYSSKNALRIAGFGNKLDCDVAYKDYPSIIRKAGLNGYTK